MHNEIDPFDMADLMNDERAIEEALLSEDAAIIAQSVDPAVMNSWENEIVDPSPRRPRDDGGPAIIV